MANKYTKELLEPIVKKTRSMRQVLAELGLVCTGGNFSHIKNCIIKCGLNMAHFKGQGWQRGLVSTIRKKPEEYLIVYSLNGTAYMKADKIKKAMIRDGIKEHKCERCKRTKWEGQPIPLALHHKGAKNDYRIEMIELLCNNCHALTPNYSGKGKNKRSVVE